MNAAGGSEGQSPWIGPPTAAIPGSANASRVASSQPGAGRASSSMYSRSGFRAAAAPALRARHRPGTGSETTRTPSRPSARTRSPRSEEHTSELQSLRHLVCRLLLEKKNQQNKQKTAGGQPHPPKEQSNQNKQIEANTANKHTAGQHEYRYTYNMATTKAQPDVIPSH